MQFEFIYSFCGLLLVVSGSETCLPNLNVVNGWCYAVTGISLDMGLVIGGMTFYLGLDVKFWCLCSCQAFGSGWKS